MKHILVIDDDPVFVKTLQDELASDLYRVSVATDGEAGLASFEEAKPDLVVLDILMPKISGIGFLKELQTRHENTVPIIVTSNLSGMEEVSTAAEYGVRGYIIKAEQNLQTIVRTIEDILSGKTTDFHMVDSNHQVAPDQFDQEKR